MCNGYTNSETWVTSLHFDLVISELIESGQVSDAIELEEVMVDHIKELYPELDQSSFLSDLVPLKAIDWGDLFETFSDNINEKVGESLDS